MSDNPKLQHAADGGCPPSSCSPSSDDAPNVRAVLDVLTAMMKLTRAAKAFDSAAWKLVEELTNDPGDFPKAIKIGSVHTDVATLRIDGVTSGPLEILTGADGSFDIYGDNYDNYGLPGRIIIDLGRGVIPENAGVLAHADENQSDQ